MGAVPVFVIGRRLFPCSIFDEHTFPFRTRARVGIVVDDAMSRSKQSGHMKKNAAAK